MRQSLGASGLSRKDWAIMQVRHLTAAETAALTRGQHRLESYCLPYFKRSGIANGFCRLRLNTAQAFPGAEARRYWQNGEGCRLYLPPFIKWEKVAKDQSAQLYFTEGEKKAASLCRLGVPCVGLGGVDSWRKEALAELGAFDLDGREACIVFDTPDTLVNPAVRRAIRAFADELRRRGAMASAKRLPDLHPGSKTGLDDFLLARGLKGFEALAAEPVELPQNSTDLGNARRLVLLHGADLRYSPALGWLAWTGGVWARDEGGAEVMRRAKDVAGAIYGEAAREKDPERKKALVKWAMASESAQRLHAAVDLARSERGVHVDADTLDADPWLLCVANGVVDLRSGKLRHARRDDLMTRRAPVHFDPRARCPTWEKFVHRIFRGDREVIAFVRRATGYTLTGDTAEKCLFFSYGIPNAGKSTLVEVFQGLLGDYSRKVSAQLLMAKSFTNASAPSPEVMTLIGRRLVVASELSDRQRFEEAFLKDLTGGIDRLAGRGLYMKEPVNFRPSMKLWLYGNHKPSLRADDDAAWNRLFLIPFEVSIPKSEQDPHLAQKLAAERHGILNWMLAGLADYRRSGLRPPAKVLAATKSYRNEEDFIGQFLEERCEVHGSKTVPLADLYNAYANWCETGGMRALTKPKFQDALRVRGFESKRGAQGAVFVRGLGVRPKKGRNG